MDQSDAASRGGLTEEPGFGFVRLCRHISSEVAFESVVFKKKYLHSEIRGTNNIKGGRKKASTERVEKMGL